MSIHRYPVNAVVWDYVRTVAGLVLVGAPLAISDTGPVVTTVLCVALAMFVVYGIRTIARHLTRIELDERGLRAEGPGGRTIPWTDLSAVRLKYYSTRRDRSGAAAGCSSTSPATTGVSRSSPASKDSKHSPRRWLPKRVPTAYTLMTRLQPTSGRSASPSTTLSGRGLRRDQPAPRRQSARRLRHPGRRDPRRRRRFISDPRGIVRGAGR